MSSRSGKISSGHFAIGAVLDRGVSNRVLWDRGSEKTCPACRYFKLPHLPMGWQHWHAHKRTWVNSGGEKIHRFEHFYESNGVKFVFYGTSNCCG